MRRPPSNEPPTRESIEAEYAKLHRYISRLYSTYTSHSEIRELYRLAEVARDNELRALAE